MNPYQKIIIDGKQIQKGHIDTHFKYMQMMDGIDVSGKKVLDIGCNLGEMVRLAKAAGAYYAKGVDCEYSYIQDAMKIDPQGEYDCCQAINVSGNYDVIIVSAMFHYIKEHDKFFNQLARVGKLVTMDVWLFDGDDNSFHLTDRDLYIPTQKAFEYIAGKYFKKVKKIGKTLSPDSSERWLYHLSEPTPKPARAVLIYGKGSMGKSTYAGTFNYNHFQFDDIFLMWKIQRKNLEYSVTTLVDSIERPYILRKQYFNLHKSIVEKWLRSHQNLDIVMEGYDPINEEYRDMVIDLLNWFGWKDVQIIEAKKPLWLKDEIEAKVEVKVDVDEKVEVKADVKSKNYSLILTTHKHPEDAGIVLKEIDATTNGMSKEIIVIGHDDADKPIGDNLPEYQFIVQPKKGCANSIWYGASICKGDWFVWLCDDHKYPQRDWLAMADKKICENPKIKVIKINAKTGHVNCAQIGMSECSWYLNHYPEPVYDHYCWDDEIAYWAREEQVYLDASDIVIEDMPDEGRVNLEVRKSDLKKNELRLQQYKLINGRMTKI